MNPTSIINEILRGMLTGQDGVSHPDSQYRPGSYKWVSANDMSVTKATLVASVQGSIIL